MGAGTLFNLFFTAALHRVLSGQMKTFAMVPVFPYVAELEKQYDEASLWNGLTSKEAGPFQTEVKKVLVEVFGLYETKQGENKPGAEKKKLVVRSPFVWKNKGEF